MSAMIVCDCGRGKFNPIFTDKCALCEYGWDRCKECGELFSVEELAMGSGTCSGCTKWQDDVSQAFEEDALEWEDWDLDDLDMGGDGVYAPTIDQSDQM